MNQVQLLARKLIKSDAQFVYALVTLREKIDNNYLSMAMPYIGIFTDGAEQWGNKVGLKVATFNAEEKAHYEKLRSKHKLFDMEYEDFYKALYKEFIESDNHFSSICRPIAKWTKLYDNVGVDYCKKVVCGNTILCELYNPISSIKNNFDGEKIKKLSYVVGKLCSDFEGYTLSQNIFDSSFNFYYKDFNFFIRCPIKRHDFDSFCLFSILCCINYILYFIDKYFLIELPTKLRFAYLQYYYLAGLLDGINNKLNTHFSINKKWINQGFRNCMAHYGLGKDIKENDIVEDDLMGGITIKFFNKNYYELKKEIFYELESLSIQLSEYIFSK